MQLYDKDLCQCRKYASLWKKPRLPRMNCVQKNQKEVDAIVKSIAYAGVRNAKRLARMAREETGFGVEADKIIKNVFASNGVYEHIKDMKTTGEIGRMRNERCGLWQFRSA